MTLLTAFSNLVKTSTSSCPGQQFFKDSDVIHFFYSHALNIRASNRPDGVGALRDISYTQRELLDEQTFKEMCKFFLDHAPRSLINRAIRSIFWCFGIRLRTLKVDDDKSYIDLLDNVEAADNILSQRSRLDDIKRAAIVVTLANGELHDAVANYLHSHADEKIWMLSLHIGYHVRRGDTPPAILDNENIILTSLQYSPRYFRWASPRIRAKRSIVLNAVKRAGWLLRYASEELRDDFEVVKVAVTENGSALIYASERLRNNRELAILALSIDDGYSEVFQYLSTELKDDEELALLALQRGEREVLAFVSERLRHLRRFVLIAVNKKGGNLEFAPPEFQDDYEVVMTAILNSGDGDVLEFASPRLRDDQRIVERAIEREPHNLVFASERLQVLLWTDT